MIDSNSLLGYRRKDGRFGLRNKVIIIPSVHCANKCVENIALANPQSVYVNHQHGCSQLDYDAEQTKKVLIGHGTNPNVYGILIVGLGCEVVQAKELYERIKNITPYKEVQYLVIQDEGGVIKTTKKGIEIVSDMINNANKVKKSYGSWNDIVLGTECGGSDAFSGLSANPVLGSVSDFIIDNNGSVILAETTELIGAEDILAKRAINEDIKNKAYKIIKSYEKVILDSNCDIRGANPSPGNIEGGLSSIEEKSLGCVYKAGNRPLVDVKEYAEAVTKKGLTLMNTPGNDIEQLSGMVAGGCNLCIFTTGRGTPTGSPITPTIKISSNTNTFNNMNDCIDLNAGDIIDGLANIIEKRDEVLKFIQNISNGLLTKAEENKQNDFSIWRLATTC